MCALDGTTQRIVKIVDNCYSPGDGGFFGLVESVLRTCVFTLQPAMLRLNQCNLRYYALYFWKRYVFFFPRLHVA